MTDAAASPTGGGTDESRPGADPPLRKAVAVAGAECAPLTSREASPDADVADSPPTASAAAYSCPACPA
jgi:hypothetical protein